MRIHLIANPAVEATAGDSTGPVGHRTGGFAQASDAYLAAGIVADFAASGAEVTGTSRPELAEDQISGDRIQDLGRHGALIADAVAGALGAGEAPLLAGGTCNHLVGMMAGLQRGLEPGARIGLVWFDAHGDFNTPRTTLSGMLGGMPVAVSAGLAYPRWRSLSRQKTPLPTDRILMVDVRNLDPPEEQLIRATDVAIAAPAPGFAGADLRLAAADLAERCDLLYLHVDADILDERYVPNHPTREPDGPSMEQTLAAIGTVMATGKVALFALVSVWADGDGGDVAVDSGVTLLRGALESWRRHGAGAIDF